MGNTLEDRWVGHRRGRFAELSQRSHFASVLRGVLFLCALAAPLVTLGAAGSSMERARRLRCIDQAVASTQPRQDVTLSQCYKD